MSLLVPPPNLPSLLSAPSSPGLHGLCLHFPEKRLIPPLFLLCCFLEISIVTTPQMSFLCVLLRQGPFQSLSASLPALETGLVAPTHAAFLYDLFCNLCFLIGRSCLEFPAVREVLKTSHSKLPLIYELVAGECRCVDQKPGFYEFAILIRPYSPCLPNYMAKVVSD